MAGYEDKIIDIDEVVGTDIKINPDFYIHNALVKAQQVLADDNIESGFLKFRILIENIEVLCKAANMVGDDYKKEIEEFVKTEDYLQEKEKIKMAKLANKKLRLLMERVFSSKTIVDSLKA